MATISAACAYGESLVVLHAEPVFQKSGMWLWNTSSGGRSTLALTGSEAALNFSPLNTSLNTRLVVYTGKLNVRLIIFRHVLGTALKVSSRNIYE